MARLNLEECKRVGELRKQYEGELARGHRDDKIVKALGEALDLIDKVEEREWTSET